MITHDDVRTVLALAARTLANPEVRAARRARDEAVIRLGAATARGEPADVLDGLEADWRVANAAYLRAKGAPGA